MDDDLRLARSICDGTLDLLCPQMELLRCPEYLEVVSRGSGAIRSDKDGRVSFRMAAKHNWSLAHVLQAHRPAGEMCDEDDYVMLKATDSQGREWRTNWLLVHLTHPSEWIPGYVVRPVDSMTMVRQRLLLREHSLRMYLPRQPPMPFDMSTTHEHKAGKEIIRQGWAIDHHRRTIGDTEVELRKLDRGWLLIEMRQESIVPSNWPGLFCHALEFATVRHARPAFVAATRSDTEFVELFSGPFRQFEPRLPRLHNGLLREHAPDFWSLVEKFFLYLRQQPLDGRPIIEDLAAIRAGASMSFSTARLALAIGVEAIGRQLLPEAPRQEWDKQGLAELKGHLESWTGHAPTKRRALGLLRSRSEPRIVDRLYAWARKHGVPDNLVDQWKFLRHPAAHGMASQETQPLYDAYYAVVELLYRIVADAIGYTGYIMETSKRGWGQEEG